MTIMSLFNIMVFYIMSYQTLYSIEILPGLILLIQWGLILSYVPNGPLMNKKVMMDKFIQ